MSNITSENKKSSGVHSPSTCRYFKKKRVTRSDLVLLLHEKSSDEQFVSDLTLLVFSQAVELRELFRAQRDAHSRQSFLQDLRKMFTRL